MVSKAEICNQAGQKLAEVGLFAEALPHFKEAISLAPNYLDAYNNLAKTYNEAGAFADSLTVCQEMLRLQPNSPAVLQNMAKTFGELGRLNEALNYYYRAIALNPDSPSTWSDLFLTLNYTFATSEAVFLEHCKYRRFDPPFPTAPAFYPPRSSNKDRRINLGYVSADFREHPVAHLLALVLQYHDRERFKIFLYSNGQLQDKITDRFKLEADEWRDIHALDNETAASLIKHDSLDLLVDLSGHTSGNRLPLFARRLAPMQVSWLGYLNTTGLSSIDYHLTDQLLVSAGSQKFYTEKLWPLVDSFAFNPPSPLPEINDLPAKKNGFFTFASLNNFKKINDRVLNLWSAILQVVPRSRLIISAKGDLNFQQSIKNKFTLRGIAPERVTIIGLRLFTDFLKIFGAVDLMLDPFPFPGCITIYHGLYAGVPSVVLQSQTEYGRNGAAVMRQVDLAQFIAKSEAEYVNTALYWSAEANWDKLSTVRVNMRSRFPANRGQAVTKNVERAFIAMLDTV